MCASFILSCRRDAEDHPDHCYWKCNQTKGEGHAGPDCDAYDSALDGPTTPTLCLTRPACEALCSQSLLPHFTRCNMQSCNMGVYLLAFGFDAAENESCEVCPLSGFRSLRPPGAREFPNRAQRHAYAVILRRA